MKLVKVGDTVYVNPEKVEWVEDHKNYGVKIHLSDNRNVVSYMKIEELIKALTKE